MPLGTNLSNDIKAILQASNTAQQAADKFAQAYYDYCSTSQFGGSFPIITTLHRDAMAATLLVALTASPGLAATAAAAFSTAVNTFWTAMPVAGASGPGTVAGCPGAGAITGGLTAVFSNLANTYATCAAGMASVLQTATLTCHAPLLTPPLTDYPIS